MTSWFEWTIPTLDFYDKLLYKYYGKVYYGYDSYGYGDRSCTVTMYCWDGKYYIDEVKYE